MDLRFSSLVSFVVSTPLLSFAESAEVRPSPSPALQCSHDPCVLILLLCQPCKVGGFHFLNLHLQAQGPQHILFCKSQTIVQSGSKLHNLTGVSHFNLSI